jgi:Fe-S oxidoreductase
MNMPLHIKDHGTRATKVSGATMAEILRAAKIEEGARIPKEISNTGRNFAKFGNPYGEGKKAKDDWVKSLGLPSNKGDTILYVGSLVPYEDNSKKMAEAVTALFRMGGIPFGMLGSEEGDSGAFLRMMGAEGLFLEMVEQNKEVLRRHGVKKIICLSPHDFDAFRHYYEEFDDVEVRHYTQVLYEKIETREIRYTRKVDKKLTYHDPCYLGRQNGIYEEPRKILLSIPGVELVEMEKSRETALCCGGGGTGLFLELPSVKIDRARVDQVKGVNPDYVVVACPNCYQMLESSLKSRNSSVAVRDIAQVMMEAL